VSIKAFLGPTSENEPHGIREHGMLVDAQGPKHAVLESQGRTTMFIVVSGRVSGMRKAWNVNQ
jgi:hypothetical protein